MYLLFLKQRDKTLDVHCKYLARARRSAFATPATESNKKKTRHRPVAGLETERAERISHMAHFCHVRFLWRFAFKRFLRLCLFIFKRRFFFRLPMVIEFGEWPPCAAAMAL
jgi:hypothetical protein